MQAAAVNMRGLAVPLIERRTMLATVRAMLIGVTVGAVLIAVFFALNAASLGRGGAERIGAAFASHALGDEDIVRGDTVIGQHQFNDCLILGMALDQRGTGAQLVVSPSVPFQPNSSDICTQLRRGARGADRYFYHNYIHGHTMLVRYLLPLMPVQSIRELYRMLASVLLMFGAASAMLRIASRDRVTESAVMLVVVLAFARGFGLESFGLSLGHGPADLVLIGFLLFVHLRAATMSPAALVFAAAIFGGLTMIFEFLTGGLPLGIAAVIGLGWFALRSDARRAEAVGAAAVAFVAAAATAIAVKYAGVALVFGPGQLMTIGRSLAVRVDGATPEFAAGHGFIESVTGGMDAMMPGLGTMALSLVVIAFAAIAWSMAQRPRAADAVLLAASNAPILVWVLVFHQHMTVHAWFMDRIFTWTIASGFALFVLTAMRRAAPTTA